jgi:adenylate cyclase
MAEADSLHIQFSDCEIDVAAFELRRGGQPCAVEPQVFELLLYLANNPDRLVTKNDLIENVWGGRIVSDSTLASRIKSARRAIGDDGEQQRFIRTVHGRGIRFIADLRTDPERPGANGWPEAGAAGMAASGEFAVASGPAVAVLPFVNLGSDPDQGFFCDGLTEDVITDLSRFRGLRVIARDSSFRYRGAEVDLQRVRQALSVRYIVTGSVRRQGACLRLTAQLTDAEQNCQLWAERFDRNAEDVFAVADELVSTIAATLAGRVQAMGSALAKRKPPANLAAYECVLRAQVGMVNIGDPAAEAECRRLFAQALQSDPGYARAHAGLAILLLRDWFRGGPSLAAALDTALEHARQAVVFDGEDSECQETLGWILLHRRSFEQSERHYRRAHDLNPNSPDELAAMGSACSYFGRPNEGIKRLEQAKRIDPYFDPVWYWHLLGAAYFNARRYDDAIAAFGRSAKPANWVTAYLAASHALAGRIDSATSAVAKLLRAAPDFSAADLLQKEPYKNAADLEHLAAGLYKAGLLTAEEAAKYLRPSIAVLPFANMSGDSAQDYFADGLTEDIIADLAKISALAVTSRNSILAYNSRTADPQQAARDLDVCYILEGRVRRIGDQVSITTQLIDGRSGLHVRAERYDRPWGDILAMRDEISRGIVAALKIQLLPQELALVSKPATNNAEAYQYYLMGRSFFLRGVWAKRALEVARQLFVKAIEIDPNYARAFAGVANCDSYRLLLGVPNASREDVAAHSARAIELDPGLAEAHAAKGLALYTSGRYEEAALAFEEAIRLGPELYEAHFFYARNCREQGLHAKAIPLFERAADLNRSDFRALGLLVDEFRALGEEVEMNSAIHRCVERLETEIANQPDNACALAFGATLQAEAGNPQRAEEWARRAIAIEPDDPVSNYNLACTFIALNKPEVALDFLRRAFPESPASRRAFIAWMLHDTAVDPIRERADYRALEASLQAELQANPDHQVVPPPLVERSSTAAPAGAEAQQFYLRGRSFLLKGVWAKRALEVARQQFAKAISLDPRFALAYAAMANVDCYRLLLGLPDASFETIAANSARARELAPDLPEVHAAIGLAHATAGRREQATAAFEKAVARGPGCFEAHFFSARHHMTHGRYDEAARLFEQAALLNTDDFGALGLLVDVYRAQGRAEDGKAAAQRCLERLEAEVSAHPDNGCALAFGAIIQAEAGNESLAEEWANRAISIEPDNVVTNYNLACAFAALGKTEIAMDWLRRAVPDSPAGLQALIEWMQHDSSLNPLRGLPAFDALMGRLRNGRDIRHQLAADLVKA